MRNARSLYDRMETDWPSKPNVLWTWGSFQWTTSPAHSSLAAVINSKAKPSRCEKEFTFLPTFTDSYDEEDLLYVWDEDQGVKFLGDVELSQFDLISSPYRNASISRKRGAALIFAVRKEVESTFILCLSELTYAYVIQVFIRSCKWVSICVESKGTFWSRSTCRAS